MDRANPVERDRDTRGLSEGQSFDLRLIAPVPVGQEFEEKPESPGMVDQLHRERLEESFSSAEGHVDWPQPPSEIGDYLFPLLCRGGVFLAPVLPDVAVEAASIAKLGQEEDGGCGTTI